MSERLVMPAGLYGKLPAKRDFVAANVPRRFLEVWEPWLQSAMATSRHVLGDDWREIYLRAPIWRFYLGASFCGEAMLGAFMPSIDGIGRYFPLTIAVDESVGALAPPEIEANDGWFEAVENVLLDALHPDRGFEEVAAAAFAVDAPARAAQEQFGADMAELSRGGVLIRDFGAQAAAAFAAGRRFGHRQTFATQTYWWTIGGEDYPPAALIEPSLPPPERFVDMLTGRFRTEGEIVT
jgi:type VI secretion system protein ImpM